MEILTAIGIVAVLFLLFFPPIFLLRAKVREMEGRGVSTLAEREDLRRTVTALEAQQRDLLRRLENVEAIVTHDTAEVGVGSGRLELPPETESDAEVAARLARRLRG